MTDSKNAPVQASNAFVDLSGISTSAFSNPYDAFISVCEDNPVSQLRSPHSLTIKY